ncbi:MAG: ADP-ribosylation factor-like protein [Gammaproteobacteria bacterium]
MSGERTEIRMFVCGYTGVGKSRLVARWVKPKEDFIDKGPTVAVDVAIRNTWNGAINYKFKIFHLGGGETFRNLLPMYQQKARIALFVFDVSNKKGLENLEPMLVEAKQSMDSDTSLILIGNKQDLKSELYMSDISKFMEKHAIKEYLLVSAKTGFSFAELDSCIFRTLSGFSDAELEDRIIRELSGLYENDSSDQSLKIQELSTKITTLKTLYEENPNRNGVKNLLNIVKILEEGIKANCPQQHFNNYLPDLKKNLDELRWTWRSVLNTVLNLILTVFATLTVVGLPLMFCLGLWNPNGHNNGVMSSFRFCTFGDKQKMQQLCEDVFEAKDMKSLQLV